MEVFATNLIPWQHKDINVLCYTKRKLTVEEERIINGVISQRQPTLLISLTDIIKDVEKVDSELAKLIVIPDAMSKLNEINSRIESLREQLEEAELEKSRLMDEIYNSKHEVIDSLPGSIFRGLNGMQITTDFQLNRYIDGGFKEEDFKGCGDMYMAYKYLNIAKTRKERLMCFRGVGEKTAEEAVRIIEEKGM